MDISKIVFNQLFTLAVPESELSDEGVGMLLDQLRYMANISVDRLRADLPKDWSWLAKVEHGTYAGTISKRLQSYLYKQHGKKLSEADVAALGNLAAQHVLEAREFYFDFDETLKWKAGEYGDKGSCFWTQKPHVLPLLKHFGGFSIRLYDRDTEKRKGIGRALIMPLVEAPDGSGWAPDQFRNPVGLLVFNGYGSFGKNYGKSSVSSQTYGQMQVYDYARLLALFLGVSYERVTLYVNDSYEHPLYVNNGGTAVLVAPTEVVSKYKAKGKLGHKEYHLIRSFWPDERISEVIIQCDRCHTPLTLDGDEPSGKRAADGHKYCWGCYRRFYANCYVDGVEFPKAAAKGLHAPLLNEDGIYLCPAHFKTETFVCSRCHSNNHLSERLYYHVPNGEGPPTRRAICRECYGRREYVSPCPVCTREYAAEVLIQREGDRKVIGPCPECRGKKPAPKGVVEVIPYLSPQALPVVVEPPSPYGYLKVELDEVMRAEFNRPRVMVDFRPRHPVPDNWDRLHAQVPFDTLLRCQAAANHLTTLPEDERPDTYIVAHLQVGPVTHADTLEIFNHYLREVNYPAHAIEYQIVTRPTPDEPQYYRVEYELEYD